MNIELMTDAEIAKHLGTYVVATRAVYNEDETKTMETVGGMLTGFTLDNDSNAALYFKDRTQPLTWTWEMAAVNLNATK